MVVTQLELEDDLGWKMSFNGRRTWIEDDLGWKMTLDGRKPWMEDNFGWKKTLDELIYYQILPPPEDFKLQLSQASSSSHSWVNN